LGEWYAQTGNREKAQKHFEEAILLTQSKAEKNFLLRKINNLSP
jgi:predicted negative regulator of RcsB-dependent stress response